MLSLRGATRCAWRRGNLGFYQVVILNEVKNLIFDL